MWIKVIVTTIRVFRSSTIVHCFRYTKKNGLWIQLLWFVKYAYYFIGWHNYFFLLKIIDDTICIVFLRTRTGKFWMERLRNFLAVIIVVKRYPVRKHIHLKTLVNTYRAHIFIKKYWAAVKVLIPFIWRSYVLK